jgi:hypothetical protein
MSEQNRKCHSKIPITHGKHIAYKATKKKEKLLEMYMKLIYAQGLPETEI